MKTLKLIVLLFAALGIIAAIGCARPPDEEGSRPEQSNRNGAQTNANVQDLAGTALYSSTLRGDVERAGLAVMMAHDFAKQEKWYDAVAQLRAAQSQIEKALERESGLKGDFEAARAALLATIASVEAGGTDVEARFTDIKTRIGALKVYTSQ